MAIHDKYYSGSSVSRYLTPGERSWAEAVYQSGKPVLDAELILNQEIPTEARNLVLRQTVPSGWVQGPAPLDISSQFSFPAPVDPGFVSDGFYMAKQVAVVAGMPVVVEYTNTTTVGWNLIQLSSAPVFGGAPPDVKRTDFVFLEVWQALVSDSPNASGTAQVLVAPTTGTITIGGVALTPAGGPRTPGADDYDNTLGTVAAIVGEIVAALNDGANSFAGTITASIDPTASDTIIIRSVASGAIGNTIGFIESTGGAEFALNPGGGFLAGGVDEPNKPTQDTIYRHGNVDAPSGVNLPDDLADPVIGTETTKRIQIQYRLRTTGQSEAVNFKTEQDGFSNANVLAQGGQVAPVVTYPFVKADNSSISANSDATAYGVEDGGLWVAGNGTSVAAAALGSVDGFVYAIPIGFVFRRNDAYNGGAGNGFAPLDNTNGALPSTHPGFVNPVIGAIPANGSDRPDGRWHDAIVGGDLMDLRRHVFPAGVDLSAELRRQIQILMDGSLATWAVDTADKQDLGAGSGDVSTRYLVCNEVGRSAAEGGVAPASGDTTRGVSIADFDHVRRRFADQPVVERICFELIPTYDQVSYPGKYVTQANGGYLGWAEDDEININLAALNATGLGNWDPATQTYIGGSGGNVIGFAPPGTQITDVLISRHDDGNYGVVVSQDVQYKLVTGLGTPHVKLVLDANPVQVNSGLPGATNDVVSASGGGDVGSQRRIFVELEVTYPIGSGTTDTPDETLSPDVTVYPVGAILENDTTQRPTDWEHLMPVRFRDPKREVQMEYVANQIGSGIASGTPITDNLVSSDPQTLYFLRRVYGSGATLTGVTDQAIAQPHDVDAAQTEYGSSSRKVVLDTSGGPPTKQPLSGAGQTQCAVTYFAQDPIPNYGAAGGGYQLACYFRSNAPQTLGSKAGGVSLPDPAVMRPLTTPKDVWTSTVGSGSVDLPFPYAVPMDQIPVNADVPISSYPGEWYFAATAQISVDDFSADTGFLNLHSMVPVDGTQNLNLSDADIDVEFRAHYKWATDSGGYRPTSFAQPLSSVNRHKVWAPLFVVAGEDTDLWRKGEVILLVITRFAELDDENTIRFTDSGNTTSAAVYRTRSLLLISSE